MLSVEIERILKENEKYAKMLEYFDSTGHLPIEKIRRSFTLKEMNVTKLRELSSKRGKSMSALLDEMIEGS